MSIDNLGKLSKSRLSILLSKLDVFEKAKAKLEQYPTDSENASFVLWSANMLGDIKNKTIADFGCGTGLLGIGALLLGAKFCYFVDSDKEAIETAKKNLEFAEKQTGMKLKDKSLFINSNIQDFNKDVDVIFQNPPFGTKQKHADMAFLAAAMANSSIIYSMHKTSTLDFLKKYLENKAKITNIFRLSMPLKASMGFHRAKIKRIDVSCLRIEKTL